MFTLINPWAVLVAAIVAYLAGWAWYSPVLWQKPWTAARGGGDANWMQDKKEMPKMVFYGFINTLLTSFVIAVFLALANVTSLLQSLQVALLLCFGFTITLKFNDMLYTAHPPHWGRRAQLIFIIDAGYQVLLFVVASSIIWWLSN